MDLITELIHYQQCNEKQGSPKGLLMIRFISKDFANIPMDGRNKYIEDELNKRCVMMLRFYNVIHESFTPEELIN